MITVRRKPNLRHEAVAQTESLGKTQIIFRNDRRRTRPVFK